MKKPLATELIFFWILFGIAGVFAFFIFSPYITALFLSLVIAIMFSEIHLWILKHIPKKETLAAVLTTALVALFILIPLTFFGILLFGEVADVYVATLGDGEGIELIDEYSHRLEAFVASYVPGFALKVDGEQYVGKGLAWMAQNLNTFFSGLLDGVLTFFITLIGLFFFLRDGEKLRGSLILWSPLSDHRDESILQRVSLAVGSVVRGSILIAILQGVLTSIGFGLFGVPNPVLWGAIAMFTSLIPSVGTAIVNVPGAVYLLLGGSTFPGVGLLLWAFVIVGTIDNILRPILIERGMHMHPFIVLLSVLGGLSFFGPVGFIAGPVIMAFFFALVEIYPSVTKGEAIPEA